jgi:hypothetical protein
MIDSKNFYHHFYFDYTNTEHMRQIFVPHMEKEK